MTFRAALIGLLVAGVCGEELVFPPVPELPSSSSLPPARYLQDASPVVIRQMCGLRRQPGRDCGLARLQLQDLLEAAAADMGEIMLGHVALSKHSDICYYDSDKPMARAKGFERPASLIYTRNWTVQQFWAYRRSDHVNGSTAFAYFSDRAESMLAVTVRRLIDLEKLATDSEIKQGTRNENVWLGGDGVRAVAHFDSSLNIFVQLHGRKRFILINPALHRVLREFSYLHPNFRRMQAAVENRTAFVTSLRPTQSPPTAPAVWRPVQDKADTADTFVATLEAGDVLIVPPYWIHDVTAVQGADRSLSYNIWSGSKGVDSIKAITTAVGRYLPFPEAGTSGTPWKREDKAIILERFLPRLLMAAFPDTIASGAKAREWLRQLGERRWSRIFERFPSVRDAAFGRFCAAEAFEGRRVRLTQLWREEALEPVISRCASAIRQVPAAGRDLEAGNLVEAIVFHVVEDARRVGGYLYHCFR